VPLKSQDTQSEGRRRTAVAAVSPYIPALDGLRALAILLVIPHNLDILGAPYTLGELPPVMVMHAGWIGVQLFFVLSGFLITGNLLDTRWADNYYSAFIARRALRILPLYYGVLLVTFVLVPLWITLPQELRETEHNQVWLWTFLLNWSAPYGRTVAGFGHFWSLAVEEQFYLLWPFVIARCSPRKALWVSIAVAGAAVGCRWALALEHFPKDSLYMFTIARMDALALGAAAAALLRIPAARAVIERRVSRIATLATVILVLVFLLTHGYAAEDATSQSYGYTALAAGFALFTLVAAMPATGLTALAVRILRWRPLQTVGRYSYAMYVFHMPLHVFFGGALLHSLAGPHPTHVAAFTYITASIVVNFIAAALSYHLFERHFLRLKEKFMPRGTATAPHLSVDRACR
jgi:peptidoglycan/LPS O-acetylase OafA/YrhL